MEERKHPQQT